MWNQFVDHSPQGSICSKTFWLDVVADNHKIVGCFKNDDLVGGIAFEERKVGGFDMLFNPKFTQFLGILYSDNSSMNPAKRESLEKTMLADILDFLESRYKRIAINNHYSIKDIRLYNWRNYRAVVRYSYLVDLSNIDEAFEQFESRNKYDIRKALKQNIKAIPANDVKRFHELHDLTFKRQGLKNPLTYSQTEKIYSALSNLNKCKLYFSRDEHSNFMSTAFIIWDNQTAYYLMGANHPEFRSAASGGLVLWTAMKELAEMGIKEFDLYGANTESIALYKRGFGGQLIPYYRVTKSNSLLFRAIDSFRE